MLLYVCMLQPPRMMGAEGPGLSGGKLRGLKRTWVVPGCLALFVAHLRWSVTHTIRNRNTHTHKACRAGLLLSFSVCHTCTHYSHLNLRTLIYREVYLPFCDPVTATPGFLRPPLPFCVSTATHGGTPCGEVCQLRGDLALLCPNHRWDTCPRNPSADTHTQQHPHARKSTQMHAFLHQCMPNISFPLTHECHCWLQETYFHKPSQANMLTHIFRFFLIWFWYTIILHLFCF